MVNVSSESPVSNPWDDATWILTSTFIVFTMQSGFGMLESGSVSRKVEYYTLAETLFSPFYISVQFTTYQNSITLQVFAFQICRC